MSRFRCVRLVLLGAAPFLASCSDDLSPPPLPDPIVPVDGTGATSEPGADEPSGAGANELAPAPNEADSAEPVTSSSVSPPSTRADEELPTVFQAENLDVGGQFAGSISSPFDGVALYANDDSVSFQHTFPAVPGVYRAGVTGASSNGAAATAELMLGARSLGELTFRGQAASVQTLEFNIRAGSPATRTLTLSAIRDNGTWDLFIDKVELELVSTEVAVTDL